MKIDTTQVTKLALTEVKGLDTISVILEDIGPRQGKINIECYGEAWSSYWGGMGNRTIAEFFCSCDEHYLAKNLSSISSHVIDYEAIKKTASKKIHAQLDEVLKARRGWDITQVEAREKWGVLMDALFDVPDISDRSDLDFNREFMEETFGEEWWHQLPEKPNHEYLYLCRIINAVKDGLRMQAACKAA